MDSSPASILRRTNELLLSYEQETHVTALVAVLQPSSGRLVLASAGHPPPVHLSPGACRLLDVPFGPPLAAFPAEYDTAQAVLARDDCLVLYTDGVTESRRGGELFGERRLVDTVAKLRGRSADEVAQAVVDAVVAFGAGLRDDLHLVVVRLA